MDRFILLYCTIYCILGYVDLKQSKTLQMQLLELYLICYGKKLL